VLAAKLDVQGEEMQHIKDLLDSSASLDLSAARIVMFGSLQVQLAPSRRAMVGVLEGAAVLCRGQLPPGLVVLVAPKAQVRVLWSGMAAIAEMSCNYRSLATDLNSSSAEPNISGRLGGMAGMT
jgi:hypothetical protein